MAAVEPAAAAPAPAPTAARRDSGSGAVTALRLQHITHDTLTTAHLFDYASTLGAQAVLGSVIFEPQSVATGAVCVHSVDRVGGIVRLEVIVFPPSGQSRRLSSSKPALLTLDVIPGVPCADLAATVVAEDSFPCVVVTIGTASYLYAIPSTDGITRGPVHAALAAGQLDRPSWALFEDLCGVDAQRRQYAKHWFSVSPVFKKYFADKVVSWQGRVVAVKGSSVEIAEPEHPEWIVNIEYDAAHKFASTVGALVSFSARITGQGGDYTKPALTFEPSEGDVESGSGGGGSAVGAPAATGATDARAVGGPSALAAVAVTGGPSWHASLGAALARDSRAVSEHSEHSDDAGLTEAPPVGSADVNIEGK